MSNALFNRVLNQKCIALFLIILVSFGVYLNTLSNDFVYDDKAEVLENPWIKDIKFIPEFFLSHSWGFKFTDSTSSHYHPMKFIVSTIQYRLFETKPWGYHLTNIIVHSMVTVMVFFIGITLFKQVFSEITIFLPAMASIVFAAHPIHTEAVAWISSMAELFMTFFYLLSFFIYINASEQKYKKFIISAILFFIAALFKETAITLPLLLIVYDYSLRKGFFADNLKGKSVRADLLKRYMPFTIAAISYLALRTYAIGGFIPQRGYAEFNAYQIIINIFPLLSKYFEMLVLPVNLNIFHVFYPVSSFSDSRTLTALGITAFFILSVIIAKRKNNGLFFSFLWIFIPLFPVFYIPAFTTESVFAERYLYLPSVGFVITAAILSRSIYRYRLFKGMTVPVLFMGLATIIVLFTLWTVKRNYVWKDNYSLWTDAVKKSPDSYVAHNNLGIAYYKDKGLIDKAIEHYQIVITLNPNYSDAYNSRGLAYDKMGQYDKAIEDYNAAITLNPNYSDAYYNRGVTHEKLSQYDKAVGDYNAAITLNPNDFEAYNNRGITYFKSGRCEEALKDFTEAIRLSPNSSELYSNRGNIYMNLGRFEEATEDFMQTEKLTGKR